MEVLAGTILPNGTFLGIVKVHGKASEAHLVVADDWADTDGYKQSPNGESGNLFNASFHPPDGAQLAEWIFGLAGALYNLQEMGNPGTCPPVHVLQCVYNTWSIPQSIYAHGAASMCKRNTLR